MIDDSTDQAIRAPIFIPQPDNTARSHYDPDSDGTVTFTSFLTTAWLGYCTNENCVDEEITTQSSLTSSWQRP